MCLLPRKKKSLRCKPTVGETLSEADVGRMSHPLFLRIVRRVGGWLGFMAESEVGKSLKTEKLGNRVMSSSAAR